MRIPESESHSYMPQSKSDIHITPDRVWEMIEEKWGYKKDEFFDPCPVNGTEGLEIEWKRLNYVNPPYPQLSEFVFKAIEEMTLAHYSIMLLPSKTDQDWFHALIERNLDILWIRKRLKFKNNKWSATQPHFLVMIK